MMSRRQNLQTLQHPKRRRKLSRVLSQLPRQSLRVVVPYAVRERLRSR
jgi:hypothetical protein